MPSTEVLLSFLITTSLFALIPGPAMLYAAGQTLARGRRSGILAALGIHIGGYVHVFGAAVGLSLLFHSVPALYAAVKFGGAAYLIWLGTQFILRTGQSGLDATEEGFWEGRKAFLESVAVEVLNPKTAIFFLAFLPQFTDPSAAFPIWLQFMVLGTMVNAIFSTIDLACVFIAALVLEHLQGSGRYRTLARSAGGALIIGLGVRLAMQMS